jgi:hypothetical protein
VSETPQNQLEVVQPVPAAEGMAAGARWRIVLAYALVAALAAMLYVPYVLRGGYITDDWGYVKNAQDFPQFWSSVRHYFPLMSHRPLVPLVMSAETALLGDRPWAYILVNLLLWFGFAALLCRMLSRRFGHVFGVSLLILATVPVLSSAAVFWPLAMTGGTLSLLMWSVSFALVIRDAERGRYSLWAYLPLLACMMLYEAVLPLFVLTAMLPVLRVRDVNARGDGVQRSCTPYKLAARYVLPPAIIALLPALSQKLFLPWLLPRIGVSAEVVTRINVSPSGAAVGGASWAFALLGGQVLLWAHGVWAALTDWNVALHLAPMAAAALGALALARQASRLSGQPPLAGQRRSALAVLLICLAAGSVIFLFSGQLACFSGGCANRTLIATWVAQALVLALLAATWKSRIMLGVVAAIFVASAAGMIVQEANCVKSWQLQQQVRAAFTAAADEQDMAGGATVIADVPRTVGGRYFYATVFQTPWDWGAMVAMPRGARGDQGAVLGARQPAGLEVMREDQRLTIHDWWKAELREVWFFRYDPQAGRGTLRKVRDAEDFDQILEDVRRTNLNPRPPAIEERLAMQFLGTLGQ